MQIAINYKLKMIIDCQALVDQVEGLRVQHYIQLKYGKIKVKPIFDIEYWFWM